MLRRKAVASLEDLAVGSLKRYLTGHCWEVARCYAGTSMEEVYQREEVLPLHIAELRSRIFQQIPWYLDAKVAKSIIAGVHEAVLEKQKAYTMATSIGLYKTQLYCMVTMVDLIITPRLKRLDMPSIPKILRTHITARLHELTGLTYIDLLLLGYGVDSRQYDSTELVAPSNIISALRCMPYLAHLILPTYCTNNLVRALATTCRDTLERLEIDHCNMLTDQVARDLASLNRLRLLSMAGSPLGSEALAKVLLALPRLVNLPNGDFLCDTLEWLVYQSGEDLLPKGPLPRFQIREFCASEEYHFHSGKQMALVAQICPNIAQIRFFYDCELLCQLQVLALFTNLTDLRLNGGDYNKDPLRPLIENIGNQLTRLELNHVENIDRHAIVQLSLCCTKLETLSFTACSFLDYGALHRELFDYYQAGGLETAEELEVVLLLRDQETFTEEVEGLIVPFLCLSDLRLASRCSTSTLTFLLLHCPALRNLFIGTNTDVKNEALMKVFLHNPLKLLEDLELRGAASLTKESLHWLVTHCPNLRRLRGLRYWTGLTDCQREEFTSWVKEANVDLDIIEPEVQDFSVFRGNSGVEIPESIRQFLSTA